MYQLGGWRTKFKIQFGIKKNESIAGEEINTKLNFTANIACTYTLEKQIIYASKYYTFYGAHVKWTNIVKRTMIVTIKVLNEVIRHLCLDLMKAVKSMTSLGIIVLLCE